MTQPPPQGPYSAPAGQPTNGLAIGALIASILGLFCLIGCVVGLILGYQARNQIDASGGAQGGRGLAVAAIVIGWVGVGLGVLGLVLIASS